MSPLLMRWGLRVALVIAAAGTLWHLVAWLHRWIGPAASAPPSAPARGTPCAARSRRS